MSYEEFNQWMVDNNLTVFEKARLEVIVIALCQLQPEGFGELESERFCVARRLAVETYRQLIAELVGRKN